MAATVQPIEHINTNVQDGEWPKYLLQKPVDGNMHLSKGLIQQFDHGNKVLGYEQSHPLDVMHIPNPKNLGLDLKRDQLQLDNNYLKLIFGGKTSPMDNIELAYNHSIRQMAESPVEKDSIVDKVDPLKFVPGKYPATKDSLIKTFEEGRRFYKGAVDTDVERFLKTRPTHHQIFFNYYGRRLNSANQSVRYNHVRGQNDLMYYKHNPNYRPFENLSSQTFAPREDGSMVPLNYALEYDIDPSKLKIHDEFRAIVDPDEGTNDAGLYFGPPTSKDRMVPTPPPDFLHLFKESTIKPRQ